MPEDYETDWEEDIDASNEQEALKRFFAGHLELSSDLGYLADDGATERVAASDSADMGPLRRRGHVDQVVRRCRGGPPGDGRSRRRAAGGASAGRGLRHRHAYAARRREGGPGR